VKRRCIFLDRDGVINVKPPEGEYVCRWEEFQFLPGIADWIRLANALGYLVIVVTNQRCVARGLLRSEDLDAIHARMVAELAQAGARIDDIFVCPHEEGTCECRKPRPGLVRKAQQQWNIDLAGSLLIGDSDCDEKLAAVCGLPFIRVGQGRFQEIVLPRRGEATE
jgi:D-glycero-D-manno-heptose 1,7-bisphosphate phosphatase